MRDMSLASVTKSVSSYLDSTAEDWLGYTLPTVPRALEQSNFKPDHPNTYCQTCGTTVGKGEIVAARCSTCRTKGRILGKHIPTIVRLGSYSGDLQLWVQLIKFKRWPEMAVQLGTMLGHAIKQLNIIDPQRTLIVPVPIPFVRRVFRGIHHAHIIAHGVSKVIDAPIVSILSRANHPTQVGLLPTERQANAKRGLRIRKRLGGWPIHDYQILLIDDIRTTGATLKACAQKLATLKPVSITAAVLAVSDEAARRTRTENAISKEL